MGETPNYGVVRPPSSLKNKFKGKEIKDMEVQILERADAIIINQTDEYLESVEMDLGKIDTVFSELKAQKTHSVAVLKRVFEISSRIQAQGISLGYQLLTAIAEDLCTVVKKMESIGETEIRVIRLHMDTMKLIIKNRIEGQGGEQGQAILQGLRKMVAKNFE